MWIEATAAKADPDSDSDPDPDFRQMISWIYVWTRIYYSSPFSSAMCC